MKVIKAPYPFWQEGSPTPIIFLAGSIEMGKAENWQKSVERQLKNYEGSILNPRRDDWDSSWVQDKDNPQFREQVRWELKGLEYADVAIFYFDPQTKSPITLLELGLVINRSSSNKTLLVCCPKGYWRKGNVDIVCQRYGVRQEDTFEVMVKRIKTFLPDPME